MGACGSNPNKQTATDRLIDEKLKNKRNQEKKEIKILLLGAGECGKSTVLKQMKLIHNNGFTEEERIGKYLPIVRDNTLEAIRSLCQACDDLDIPLEDELSPSYSANIRGLPNSTLDPYISQEDVICYLWEKEPSIRKVMDHASEFHLLDSASYFLDRVRDTFREDYKPSDDDILRTRLPTVGIIETQFLCEGFMFRLFDVGGQRGERKKWIHCFDNARAIMFVASLTEYDQMLKEDRTKNRMVESINLFEGIINLPWFTDTAIILFLNKKDLLRPKL